MRIYFAHRLTGENLPEMRKRLEELSAIITELGHEPFIFWRDIQNWISDSLPMDQIFERCQEEIDKSDMIFVFADGNEKSEGMLIECGYAKARNKRFIVAIREGVQQQWLQYLGKTVLPYKDMEELIDKIKKTLNNE